MTGYTDQEFRQILDRNREERAEAGFGLGVLYGPVIVADVL